MDDRNQEKPKFKYMFFCLLGAFFGIGIVFLSDVLHHNKFIHVIGFCITAVFIFANIYLVLVGNYLSANSLFN